MKNDFSINLHFDNYYESLYLIKFGRKEHLEQIKNGKIRFSYYKKYWEIENNNIGDIYEGLSSIHFIDNNSKVYFNHPLIYNNISIDCTKSINTIYNYPDNNKYISCFSYITARDIYEDNIFDNSILDNIEWDNVLFILDTKGFVDNIKKSLAKYNLVIGKVNYIDYNINQYNLNIFSKSNKYKNQKEIRFAFDMINERNENIILIDKDTIEITFQNIQSVIIPTKEFKSGFILDNCTKQGRIA
jgi:hypothetical protein